MEANVLVFNRSDGAAGEGIVKREDLGEAWPLTVEEARLGCEGKAAYITANGRTYALNGTAALQGMPPIDPVWAKHPSIPGVKIDLGELLKLAMQPCQ